MKFTVDFTVEGVHADPERVLKGLLGKYPYEGVEEETGDRPGDISYKIREVVR